MHSKTKGQSHSQHRAPSVVRSNVSREPQQRSSLWQPSLGNQALQQLLKSGAEDPKPKLQPESSQSTSMAGAIVKLPLRGIVHPIAALMNHSAVQFRVPTFADLKAAYTDKTLNIPEAVIKARVTQLLQRLEKEKKLKSSDPVPTIVGKIFPGGGKIVEAEFNNAVDVADRTRIYQSVIEADTKIKDSDKPKLQTEMKNAATLVKKVAGDASGLKQVFGTKDSVAKSNYDEAAKALEEVAKNTDAHVTTDYNLDDPEVGLGGFANHADQKMHLVLKVAQVKKPEGTKATLIHEAAHFANATVKDHVYYGKPGFFEAEEAIKVANAAHYEELPRREMGTSSFDKKTFTPGKSAGGGAVTREEKVKAATANYMRMAWDAGVDAHLLIRSVRREIAAGNVTPFNDKKATLLEISKVFDLTIHTQSAGKESVTMLDVTLSESVARGIAQVKGNLDSVTFPSPVGALTDDELRDKIIADATTQYGNLLRDAKRDKALIDWCASHYKKVPRVK